MIHGSLPSWEPGVREPATRLLLPEPIQYARFDNQLFIDVADVFLFPNKGARSLTSHAKSIRSSAVEYLSSVMVEHHGSNSFAV